MLLITVETDAAGVTVRFDGRLAGPEARDLAGNWVATPFTPQPNQGVLFDVTGVTVLDAAGMAFLKDAHCSGVTLIGGGATRGFVDEIVGGFRPNNGVEGEAGAVREGLSGRVHSLGG